MLIHLTEARHVGKGEFELAFSDGRRGRADLSGILKGPIFEP
jgi:hypothetical protein